MLGKLRCLGWLWLSLLKRFASLVETFRTMFLTAAYA